MSLWKSTCVVDYSIYYLNQARQSQYFLPHHQFHVSSTVEKSCKGNFTPYFSCFVCLFFRVCTHACNLWWGVFSEAPWLRKFGNLSIRENLLWRQRTTERWPYRLWGRGESGVRPSGEEYEMAEVKCLHFKHPARFGGKSHGHPDV